MASSYSNQGGRSFAHFGVSFDGESSLVVSVLGIMLFSRKQIPHVLEVVRRCMENNGLDWKVILRSSIAGLVGLAGYHLIFSREHTPNPIPSSASEMVNFNTNVRNSQIYPIHNTSLHFEFQNGDFHGLQDMLNNLSWFHDLVQCVSIEILIPQKMANIFDEDDIERIFQGLSKMPKLKCLAFSGSSVIDNISLLALSSFLKKSRKLVALELSDCSTLHTRSASEMKEFIVAIGTHPTLTKLKLDHFRFMTTRSLGPYNAWFVEPLRLDTSKLKEINIRSDWSKYDTTELIDWAQRSNKIKVLNLRLLKGEYADCFILIEDMMR